MSWGAESRGDDRELEVTCPQAQKYGSAVAVCLTSDKANTRSVTIGNEINKFLWAERGQKLYVVLYTSSCSANLANQATTFNRRGLVTRL